MAKARAWLNRSWTIPAAALEAVRAGPYRLDPVKRKLTLPDRSDVKLTNLEFRVLHILMTRAGQPLPPQDITERVWGYVEGGEGPLLKHVIYRLRHKIESDPGHPSRLLTVPYEGYCFQAEPAAR
jgi:DNA-binding response OmpR family regulator